MQCEAAKATSAALKALVFLRSDGYSLSILRTEFMTDIAEISDGTETELPVVRDPLTLGARPWPLKSDHHR